MRGQSCPFPRLASYARMREAEVGEIGLRPTCTCVAVDAARGSSDGTAVLSSSLYTAILPFAKVQIKSFKLVLLCFLYKKSRQARMGLQC